MGALFSDAPEAPDASATAAAQTAGNKEVAAFNQVANRPNVFTPYGSQTWQQYGTDPTTGAALYDQFIDLSPEAQATVDQNISNARQLSSVQSEFLDNARNTLSNPIDQSSIPDYRYDINNDDYSNSLKQAQDAVYNKQASYLDPQFESEQQQLSAQLANQGIPMGTEAHTRALDDFARRKQQAYGNARNDAIVTGNSLQNQLFGQDLARNQNFNNNVNQQLNRQLQLNNQPLNQYNALAQGTQVNVPQFQQTPITQIPNTDIAGLINQQYQGQLGAYNADVASTNALIGAAVSAGTGMPTGTFSGLFANNQASYMPQSSGGTYYSGTAGNFF